MIQFAGKLLSQLKAAPPVQRFLASGGQELIQHSVPGSILTGGLTALATGNPLAGLAVGATDLVTSSALARGLGSKTVTQNLEKLGLGKLAQALPGRTETITANGKTTQRYAPSTIQQVAMGVGSIGSAIALEPLFAGGSEAQENQMRLQQLMGEPADIDQTVTSDQQVLQRQLINRMQQGQQLSPGTLYQTQGLRTMQDEPDPNADQYRLNRRPY
jgi:hypothetical protein